jgi:hypothetical protein
MCWFPLAVGLAVASALAGVTGCVDRAGFACDSDEQCDLAGGACEPNGYCSFGDPRCGSGRRFGNEAPGGIAGECVGTEAGGDGDAGDVPIGGPDAAPGAPDAAPGAPDAAPRAPDAAPATPDAAPRAPDAAPAPPDAAPAPDAAPPPYAPSNIDRALIDRGAGRLVVTAADGTVEIDTDRGTITRLSDGARVLPPGASFTLIPRAGWPSLGVFSLGSLRVAAGAELRAVGAAALVLAVADDVVIAGVVDVGGGYPERWSPGPGGYKGGTADAPFGLGPGGGAARRDNGDVGGGGAGHVATGGTGGSRAGKAGGAAGASYGASALVPLVGGSGGGAGADFPAAGGPPGDGGGGGGAVQISAGASISLEPSGIIDAGGAGGQGGAGDNGGGGGGAGGAILLEAPTVEVAGVLAANGGSGGGGANHEALGAAGEDGRRSASRAAGGPRAPMGEGGAGGRGGAGGEPGGEDAEPVTGASPTPSNPMAADNAGGGGGAGGRVRLRSDGLRVSGTVSPTAGRSEAGLD